MQRKRQSTYEMDCIGKGIFPPMKSSDWPGEYQSWCITDCTNLQGYDRLAEAFAQYHDPRAQEIRDAHTDYMTCMRRLLDAEVAKNTRGDEILLTNKIGVELTDPPSGPYFDGRTARSAASRCDGREQRDDGKKQSVISAAAAVCATV